MQLVAITIEATSAHPVNDKVYSIRHYVIKSVSDLQKVGGILHEFLFPSPIKLGDRHETCIL